MKLALKGACFIAFTGTPLATKQIARFTKGGKTVTRTYNPKRSTFEKFGALFTPSYTISRAIEDGAVTPLLYQAPHVPQDVDQGPIDS